MMLGQITRCPTCGHETGPIHPEDFHCPNVLVLNGPR